MFASLLFLLESAKSTEVQLYSWFSFMYSFKDDEYEDYEETVVD